MADAPMLDRVLGGCCQTVHRTMMTRRPCSGLVFEFPSSVAVDDRTASSPMRSAATSAARGPRSGPASRRVALQLCCEASRGRRVPIRDKERERPGRAERVFSACHHVQRASSLTCASLPGTGA